MREELEDVFEFSEDEELLHQEIYENKKRQRKKWGILTLCFLALMSYLYSILFGDNSWSVRENLLSQKNELEKQETYLKQENVNLQKQKIELQGLESEEKE